MELTNRHTIVSINLGNFGSTGSVVRNVLNEASKCGYQTFKAFPRDKKEEPFEENDIIISSEISKKISQRICRYIGLNGCAAFFATKRLLGKLKKINPSILHLHNLHNSYINLPLLFRYIKSNNISVVWTLHDCWSFTGQCPHFTFVKCDEWKSGCGNCCQYKNYPESAYDNTRRMFRLKRKWFTGVKNMTIVTPSKWLAQLVKQSYLSEYSVQVINNGIDLEVFRPRKSDFREKYHIPEEKFVLLGVAFDWGVKKGLDVFCKLYEMLDGDVYQIVLVGVNEKTKKQLPDGMITIARTSNQYELSQIYSAVDLFVNPTREDTFPTVNMESLACGTPILTFETGGSPEMIDERTGVVVPCGDVEKMRDFVLEISKNKNLSKDACLQKAKDYDRKKKYAEYVELFDVISKGMRL